MDLWARGEEMTRFRQCRWLVGLMLLLPGAGGPAQAQGPEEGWQVYTNANGVNDLALEGGGALRGGYTWVATDGGVVCYSADQHIKFTTLDGLADNKVHAIAEDGGGRWWLGTEDGVSVLDDGGTPFDKADDTWTSFTESDGLAHAPVFAIAVDGGGRWWFGTWCGGVSVLDDRGTPFHKGDDTWATFATADGLADNCVLAITADGGERLWFGASSGVSVLDHGGTPFDKGDDIWTTFTTADGLAGNYVHAVVADGGGQWWFGTSDGASVLDNRGTPFDKGDDTWATFTTNYVGAIAMDGGGRWWFGTWSGVSVLDNGGTPFDKGDDTWTTFTSADGLADNYVEAIATDGGGWWWFGTSGGVSVLNNGQTPFDKGDDTWTTFTESDDLAGNQVRAISVDGGGRLWFGGSGGVSVLDDGGTPFDKGDNTWITFTTTDGLAYNSVDAIAKDGGGRMWFGTWKGMNVLDDGGTPFDKRDDNWITFTTADGLADNDVSAIAVDGGGRLWFGFGPDGGGVSVLDDGGTPFDKGDDTWTTFTTVDGLANNQVHAIAVDGRGRMWFGTRGAASMLDDKGTPSDKGDDTWATFTTTAFGLADHVTAIARDGEGRWWFGTYGGGVSVLDNRGTPFDKGDDAWATFTIADGMASNIVFTIARDGGGRWWFGTYGGGVSVLDNRGTPFDKGDDVWTNFTSADGLADNDVGPIAVDDGGHLWFGTNSGVGELVDAIAPVSSAHSPAYANGKVSVPWSAGDGASGIFRVTLWVKYENRSWTKTALSQRGQITGTFTYTPTHGDGTYSFATVAEDWMGNVEASPTGRGDCSTCVGHCYVYLPVVLKNRRIWDAYYEENDDWLAAYGPLVSGRTYLAYPDDVEDYYYFVLSAPATVNVSVTDFAPTSSNGTVMLYGPATGSERGNRIDYYGPPGDSSMSLGPHSLGPGKYYVRVNTAKGYGCKSQIVNLCHQREREISLNTAYSDGLLVTFAATGG